MMGGMGFQEPVWLWALALLPVLLALAVRAERARARDVSRLLAARLAPRLTAGVSPALRWSRAGLFLLALAAGVVTLARPHAGHALRETKSTGRDVILAIDVSRSMLANDLQPNRLVRAQLLADDMVRQLPGDRVGVVAFAGTAFLQAPLTVDHGAVLESVQALDTDIIPRGGSNIAQAMRTAMDAFGKGESAHRALVILSDGEELDADALPVAREVAEAGVRIFTVGIGTPNGSVIPVPDERGGTEFVKDAAGGLVTSRLDESRLREIAQLAGGGYFHLATDSGAGRGIADAIRAIKAGEAGSEVTREPLDRFQWPLGVAVAALLAALLLPERAGARRLKAASAASPVLALLLASGFPLHAADTGAEAFAEGKFDEALEAFAARADKSGTPRDAYNAGTAALKANRFDDAIARLGGALAGEDAEALAASSYNLASALSAKAALAGEPATAIPLVEDAIRHFREAESAPSVAEDASFNRKAAEEWLEALKNLQEQQEEQQQNQQNQQGRDGEQQEQQNQEEQNQGQDQKDGQESQRQQGGEQGEEGEQQQGGKEGEGQQQQDGQQGENEREGEGEQQQPENPGAEGERDEERADGQSQGGEGEPTPAPTPVPGQNEGTLDGEMEQRGGTRQEEGRQGEPGEAAQPAEAMEAPDGEMTAGQARAILESLRGDERRVLLLEREQRQQLPTDKNW